MAGSEIITLTMQNMINKMVKKLLEQQLQRFFFTKPFTFIYNNKWNVADIGYFDPQFDKSYGENNIMSINKDTYFRNIYLFVEKIGNLVLAKSNSIFRTNLNITFRNSAHLWYTTELSNFDRIKLKTDDNGLKT